MIPKNYIRIREYCFALINLMVISDLTEQKKSISVYSLCAITFSVGIDNPLYVIHSYCKMFFFIWSLFELSMCGYLKTRIYFLFFYIGKKYSIIWYVLHSHQILIMRFDSIVIGTFYREAVNSFSLFHRWCWLIYRIINDFKTFTFKHYVLFSVWKKIKYCN